ncbi:hypothetical protein Dimus_028075 [Dionaea muscipula]
MPPEKAKKLKKQLVEDDEETLRSIPQARQKPKKEESPGADNATPRSKADKIKKERQEEEDFSEEKKPVASASSKKLAKPKKEEQLNSDSDDNKSISRKPRAEIDKKENKTKKEVKKRKNDIEETSTRKRERKVYNLPGQKRDPPEERDPLRIFYETLYQQVPGSEMAAIWMMESGLLPAEEAKEVYERKQKRSHLNRLGSPIEAVASTNKRAKSVTVEVVKSSGKSSIKKKMTLEVKKSKKGKKDESSEEEEEEDTDEEFVVSRKLVKKKERVAQ